MLELVVYAEGGKVLVVAFPFEVCGWVECEDVEGGGGGVEVAGCGEGEFCCFEMLEWNGLFEGWWMCSPSLAEAALTRGMLQGLDRLAIGQLNTIRPSE